MAAVGNANSVAVKLPAPKAAPSSSAGAYQAFHTSEAAAGKPSVQRANANLASRAIAAQPLAAFHAEEAAPLPKLKTSSKGVIPVSTGRLAAIMSPAAAIQTSENLAKGGGGVVGRLLGQISQLPASTLEGVTQLGGAGYQAVAHGNLHPLGHLLSSAVTNDPIVRAISEGSLKPLGQDPLGTLLDASIAYGGVGKLAGAVARSGRVGATLKDAAALGSREPFIAAPEVPGSAVARAYSPNVFTKIAQKARDAREGGTGRVDVAKANAAIRRQVAMAHTAETGQRGADEAAIVKGMAGAKAPLGPEERNVASIAAGFGIGPEEFPALRAEMERSPVPIDPVKAAQREENIQMLRDAEAKYAGGNFDMIGTGNATEVHDALRAPLEIQKRLEGLRADTEMERALDKRRALLEPNVHPLKQATTDPLLRQAFKDAKDQAKTAKENLATATRERAATLGQYSGASRTLSDITKKIPVAPNTDPLLSHALDLRKILDETLGPTKAYHDARVAYHEEAAANATKALQEARKAMASKKIPKDTAMIEDPTVPQMTHGNLKGMRVRPIEPADVAEIRKNDPFVQSFVSMRNPDVEGAQSMQTLLGFPNDVTVPAETGGKAYTGEAILGGDFRPGWSLMTNSLIRDNRAVSALREWRNFLDRWSIPNDKGFATHASRDAAAAAAKEYKDRTGLDTAMLTDQNGGIHLVPKAAADELRRQWSRDQPKGLERAIVKGNRLFRKTVLPYSVKLPVMHQVENTTRIAALEKGNVLRAIPDYMRGRAILRQAGPIERARLQSLVTPGSLSRAGAGGEAEDLGRLAVDRSAPAAAIHAAGSAIGEAGTQIIRAQRAMEHAAQTTALGAHARQLLQEAGHSWLDANTNVTRYVDELRQGFANPATVERAAASMHRWLGQYNAFTGRERAFLRMAPFASWYMNAAKLVFLHLPRDHPLFSALVHDVNLATQQDWAAQHAGLPADLQSAASVGPNAWLDIGKFTPIGVQPATLQGLGQTAAGLTLPYLSSPALAIAGKDPFMQDLKGPNAAFGEGSSPTGIESGGEGTKQAALSAVEQLLEAVGGPLNDASRLIYEHGGTFYNTATPVLHLASGGLVGNADVKPGSTSQARGFLNLPAAIDRVLDPFHPTTFGSAGAVKPIPIVPGAVTPLTGGITPSSGGITPISGGITPGG